MIPPVAAIDGVLNARDAVDIPVLLRRRPARRPYPQWSSASQPWPGRGIPSELGWYLATTTWREIVESAIAVGRDAAPWIARVPQLAGQELLARISPLSANLVMDQARWPQYGCGRRLVPSPIYTHGTERSGRAAFAYRLGMTMADWAPRKLLGLGPTLHTETNPPPGSSGWSDPGRRPDLHGLHPLAPERWIIEAKAARKIGRQVLGEGEDQLQVGGNLMSTPHRQVLCGASIEDQVFLTLDDVSHGWGHHGQAAAASFNRPSVEEFVDDSDEALALVTQAEMLIFRFLRYAPPQVQRSVVAVSNERRPRSEGSTGVLTTIEDSEATAQIRARLMRQPLVTPSGLRSSEIDDFLTAVVPGTGVRVGISRRLYAACERRDDFDRAIVRELPEDIATAVAMRETTAVEPQAQEIERRRVNELRSYRELADAREEELRPGLRAAFDSAGDLAWDRLTERELEVRIDSGQELEAATPDTYIAIEPTDPVISSAQS